MGCVGSGGGGESGGSGSMGKKRGWGEWQRGEG